LTVWPKQASHANGDRWVVEHHDQIRRMNPRLLVLNFDNHDHGKPMKNWWPFLFY